MESIDDGSLEMALLLLPVLWVQRTHVGVGECDNNGVRGQGGCFPGSHHHNETGYMGGLNKLTNQKTECFTCRGVEIN